MSKNRHKSPVRNITVKSMRNLASEGKKNCALDLSLQGHIFRFIVTGKNEQISLSIKREIHRALRAHAVTGGVRCTLHASQFIALC